MIRRANVLMAALVLASAFVYLIGNGSVSLWDRDEPRYAETSRQMLQSGDWVVPHYLDKPRTAKPAFIYWCQAAAMKIFGDNEFAARFPSATATVILLIVLWRVLSRFTSAEMALWTVFIFATSGLVIAAAKMCITDAVLLLWVTIGQICLYAIYRGHWSWPVVITLAVATGLAGLTKGPVILGIQATTVIALGLFRLFDMWWTGDRRPPEIFTDDSPGEQTLSYQRLRPIYWIRATALEENLPYRKLILLKVSTAIAIVIAIVLPWVLMVNHRASGFFWASLKLNVWDRMMTPLEQHKGPPGYYFLTIWLTFFPWSLMLPLAIGVALVHRADPRSRFALAAIVGPWILLECVKTKLPHYFLPVFPPLAYLTADALMRCIRGELRDLHTKAFIIPLGIWAVLVAVVASAPWLVKYDPLPHRAMLALSIFGVIFGATVFAAFQRRRIALGATAMGLGTLAIIAMIFGCYLPNAQYLRLSPRLAKILIDHHITHKDQVIMLGYMEPSLAFAQGGTIREAGNLWLSRKLEPSLPEWIVVTKTLWDAAPPDMQDDFEVVGREFGLAYADKGKWEWVLVIRKKN